MGRYLLVLCCVLQGMMWPSGYRRIFSGDIGGSDLTVGFFFFVNFVLHVFKYHFCSLLVSVFLILLIIFVKFTYSINRKLYCVLCFTQLTKFCVKVFSGL